MPVHLTDAEVYRHRFEVIAPTVAHAVQSVGGAICDRAMSGWDVAVSVMDDAADAGAALAILGATPMALTASPVPAAGRIIAVAGEILSYDRAVRAAVDVHVANRTASVLLWGERTEPMDVRDCGTVEFKPSQAAQLFKRHALAALGLTSSPSTGEMFWRRTSAWA